MPLQLLHRAHCQLMASGLILASKRREAVLHLEMVHHSQLLRRWARNQRVRQRLHGRRLGQH